MGRTQGGFNLCELSAAVQVALIIGRCWVVASAWRHGAGLVSAEENGSFVYNKYLLEINSIKRSIIVMKSM